MKHGIFANKCLDEEERTLFREVIDSLYQDFTFNRSSDFIQIEFIGINTVKYMRAVAEGWQGHTQYAMTAVAERNRWCSRNRCARYCLPGHPVDAAQKLNGMIRANMKDVKTTKISREGDQPKSQQYTPADWAADLLKKSDAEPAKKKAVRKKEKGK